MRDVAIAASRELNALSALEQPNAYELKRIQLLKNSLPCVIAEIEGDAELPFVNMFTVLQGGLQGALQGGLQGGLEGGINPFVGALTAVAGFAASSLAPSSAAEGVVPYAANSSAGPSTAVSTSFNSFVPQQSFEAPTGFDVSSTVFADTTYPTADFSFPDSSQYTQYSVDSNPPSQGSGYLQLVPKGTDLTGLVSVPFGSSYMVYRPTLDTSIPAPLASASSLDLSSATQAPQDFSVTTTQAPQDYSVGPSEASLEFESAPAQTEAAANEPDASVTGASEAGEAAAEDTADVNEAPAEAVVATAPAPSVTQAEETTPVLATTVSTSVAQLPAAPSAQPDSSALATSLRAIETSRVQPQAQLVPERSGTPSPARSERSNSHRSDHDEHEEHEEHEPHAAHDHEHDHTYVFGSHDGGLLAIRTSLIHDAVFFSGARKSLELFVFAAELTHRALSKVRINLANVISSATSDERIFPPEIYADLQQTYRNLKRDATARTAELALAQKALGVVNHVTEEKAAEPLLELWEQVGALFLWEMQDRERYAADLTRARLETVATAIDSDSSFRSRFAPSTLAALQDSNAAYKQNLYDYTIAVAELVAWCTKEHRLVTGAAQEAWSQAKDALSGASRDARRLMSGSDTGFPDHPDFRISYATQGQEGARADVELCERETLTQPTCVTAHVALPQNIEHASAESELQYYACGQFPRLPPATLHFKVPSEADTKMTFREWLAQPKEDYILNALLFELVYSLAGMYSIMGLQLNCFRTEKDLDRIEVFDLRSSEKRIYVRVLGTVRKDWGVPASAPFALIRPEGSLATCWRPKSRMKRKFVTESDSAADVGALLWLLLKSGVKRDAALALATECFGSIPETGTMPKPVASVFALLDSPCFERLKTDNIAGIRPTCVWGEIKELDV